MAQCDNITKFLGKNKIFKIGILLKKQTVSPQVALYITFQKKLCMRFKVGYKKKQTLKKNSNRTGPSKKGLFSTDLYKTDQFLHYFSIFSLL